MNSLLLISPAQGSGFKPILSGKGETERGLLSSSFFLLPDIRYIRYRIRYRIRCRTSFC